MRRRNLSAETGLDEATVQTILSELVTSGVLEAKIQIRCPYCSTQHGIYSRKSAVPDEMKICFDCSNEVQLSEQRNWGVIYQVTGDPGDFFQENNIHIRRFLEDSRKQPSEFFISEFQRFQDLEDLDSPQERGREFDYLMGLLFQQLPGVEIRVKQQGTTGEVDVHMVCLQAAEWIHRLLGAHTLIENKWEKDPIGKDEVDNLHSKASEIPQCNFAYFVSMSGFSRGQGKETGALANLRNFQGPQVIDFWADDVEDMMEMGTPEQKLRQRMMK